MPEWLEVATRAGPVGMLALGAYGAKWWHDRIREMQAEFLKALQDLQVRHEQERAGLQDRLERHRTEHLADTKLFAEKMGEVARLLRQSSPPSSR